VGDCGDTRRLMFLVPIYRLTEDAFYQEQNALMEPHLAQLRIDRSEVDAWTLASQTIGWFSWDFNEVVGWVTLHGFHDMVKMYLWWTKSKSIRRGGRHVFECYGKFTETLLSEDMTNEQIGDEVRDDLVSALREEPKSRRSRHLDLKAYDAISPWLDWRAALRACEQRT
jgi:hypothetical protein